jgi:hypothetical protein
LKAVEMVGLVVEKDQADHLLVPQVQVTLQALVHLKVIMVDQQQQVTLAVALAVARVLLAVMAEET